MKTPKRKLPAGVKSVLRFISENMQLSGFSGKITPKTEAHALKLFRAGKLERKPPFFSREALKAMHERKPRPTQVEWIRCERRINEGLANVREGLRELRELIRRCE